MTDPIGLQGHRARQDHRRLLISARLRKFANEVKASNMALRMPDELFDSIPDADLAWADERLRQLGLTQRDRDGRWERA